MASVKFQSSNNDFEAVVLMNVTSINYAAFDPEAVLTSADYDLIEPGAERALKVDIKTPNKDLTVLTSYPVFIMNDQGKTVDRLN